MADLTFNCPLCGQNLTTDEGLSGSEIECPSCTKPIKIPSAGDENVQKMEAEPTAPTVATEPEPKKLAVPEHGDGEILLKKESSKNMSILRKIRKNEGLTILGRRSSEFL